MSELPNAELGWEYSSTWNFGLDFTLLGGRLSGTLEYYIQNTTDLLQSVSLPETLKVINEGAFYYCENLKTLGHTDDGVLPKGLTTMGVKAFYFCKALEGDLVIPEGVISLSAGIFYNAFALTSITIPDTVTSMDANGDQ